MKTIGWTLAAALLLLLGASLGGIVGFRYPRVVENQPLKQPARVLRVDGNQLQLSDSRVVEIQSNFVDSLKDVIAESDFLVDIQGEGAFVTIHARRDGWICGTPWAQPIRIPVIPDTVYRNRLEMIAYGELRGAK